MPLADLQDISVSSAIYLQDSEGQKAFGTLVEAKMLRLLESGSLGIYASATAQGTPNGRIGTTNIYRKPRNLQTEEYDPTNTSTQIPTYDTIKVDVDIQRALRWQDESFDLDRLEIIPVSQLISEIARSGFMSITAELDAFFISEVIKAAGAWAATNGGANIIKADFQSLLAADAGNIRELGAKQTLKLTHEIAKITKRFDRYTYGIQQSELLTIIDPEVMPMINTGFQGYAGDNLQIAKNTTFSTQEINGVSFATHPLVGQNLPAGSAFSLDQAYKTDTITIAGEELKIAGILIHREAYAMPIMTQPKIRMAINPNNMNDIFMIKWQYGGGIIRPNMFWLIVDVPAETPEDPGEGGETLKAKSK